MTSSFFQFFTLLTFLALSKPITSTPHHPPVSSLPLPIHLIHQFSKPTLVENIAVRSNGQLLVTLTSIPDLYLIDPSQPPSRALTLIHSFPSALGLLGITELHHDIFYVAVGNFSLATFANTPGSYSIWEVNMRDFTPDKGAAIKKVTAVPEASFINGLTTLSESADIIAMADSTLGVVWRLNVKTGIHSIAVDVPAMKMPPPPAFQVGINGIKIRKGHLYFTNSGQGIFNRIAITEDGAPAGNVTTLATHLAPDDFCLDQEGNAWIAQNAENLVSVWSATDGKVVDVVGMPDQLTVAGVTACGFGRGPGTRKTLYLTTAGGLLAPVNGTVTEGGKVVSVDTAGFDPNEDDD